MRENCTYGLTRGKGSIIFTLPSLLYCAALDLSDKNPHLLNKFYLRPILIKFNQRLPRPVHFKINNQYGYKGSDPA